MVATVLFILAAGLFLEAFVWISERLEMLWPAWVMVTTIAKKLDFGLIIVSIILIGVFVELVRESITYFRQRSFVGLLKIWGMALGGIVGLITSIILFGSLLLGLFWITLSYGRYTSRGIGIIAILLAILLAVFFLLKPFLYNTKTRWSLSQSDTKFEPDSWKRMMAQADAHTQQLLLNRINVRELNEEQLKQALSLLEEIEHTIEGDPAASIYWDKRNNLEEILKQKEAG